MTTETISPTNWPDKDPDEVLDYKIDWSARLNGDTINHVTWTVPSGITTNSTSFDSTSTTIWLSGGVESMIYQIQCEITTAGGRTMDQTVPLAIRTR